MEHKNQHLHQQTAFLWLARSVFVSHQAESHLLIILGNYLRRKLGRDHTIYIDQIWSRSTIWEREPRQQYRIARRCCKWLAIEITVFNQVQWKVWIFIAYHYLGCEDCVQILLQNGWNIDATNINSETPLHKAASNGRKLWTSI